MLAFGRRDGVSADRLLWAALTQRRQTPRAPRRPAAGPRQRRRSPDTDPCRRRRGRRRGDHGPRARSAGGGPRSGAPRAGPEPGSRRPRPRPRRLGRGVRGDPGELHAALRPGTRRAAGRVRPLAALAGLRRCRSSPAPTPSTCRPPSPGCAATPPGCRIPPWPRPPPPTPTSARTRSAAELLHREFLIVFRTPIPHRRARARRGARASSARDGRRGQIGGGGDGGGSGGRARLHPTASPRRGRRGLLGGIGLRVTPLDPAEAARVLPPPRDPTCGARTGAAPHGRARTEHARIRHRGAAVAQAARSARTVRRRRAALGRATPRTAAESAPVARPHRRRGRLVTQPSATRRPGPPLRPARRWRARRPTIELNLPAPTLRAATASRAGLTAGATMTRSSSPTSPRRRRPVAARAAEPDSVARSPPPSPPPSAPRPTGDATATGAETLALARRWGRRGGRGHDLGRRRSRRSCADPRGGIASRCRESSPRRHRQVRRRAEARARSAAVTEAGRPRGPRRPPWPRAGGGPAPRSTGRRP